eukprot:5248696-Prymnesium_polylepis.2
MLAPHFSYTVTQDLFGVSEWKVYQARLHAAEYGGARPIPPRVGSFRIKPEAAEHLNAFANTPENVQIIATYEGKARKPIVELKQVPEKLWLKYAKVTSMIRYLAPLLNCYLPTCLPAFLPSYRCTFLPYDLCAFLSVAKSGGFTSVSRWLQPQTDVAAVR